jgi:hypothetical protein
MDSWTLPQLLDLEYPQLQITAELLDLLQDTGLEVIQRQLISNYAPSSPTICIIRTALLCRPQRPDRMFQQHPTLCNVDIDLLARVTVNNAKVCHSSDE